MSSKSAPGIQITEVDLVILRALTRYQGATMAMVMRRYFPGHHRTGVYARLRRLVRAGLLEDLHSGPSNLWRPAGLRALYVPTASGYAMTHSHLRARPLVMATVEHTIAIAEIGLAEERPDVTVWTDREIAYELSEWRQSNGALAPSVPLWLSADVHYKRLKAGPVVRTHRPDLVIHDARPGRDSVTAVEVEMSVKGATRLKTLLRWYVRSQTFDRVRYVVRDEAVKRNVVRAITSLPEDERRLFEVTTYEPLHNIEPEREQDTDVFAAPGVADLPDGSDLTPPAGHGPDALPATAHIVRPVSVTVIERPRLPARPRPWRGAASETEPPVPTVALPGEGRPRADEEVASPGQAEGVPNAPGKPKWWDLPGAPGMWPTD